MDPKYLYYFFIRWPIYWMKFWYKRLGSRWFWIGMGFGVLLAVVLNHAT